jgi:hypothetical protein
MNSSILTAIGFIGFLAAKLGADSVKLYEADKEVDPCRLFVVS